MSTKLCKVFRALPDRPPIARNCPDPSRPDPARTGPPVRVCDPARIGPLVRVCVCARCSFLPGGRRIREAVFGAANGTPARPAKPPDRRVAHLRAGRAAACGAGIPRRARARGGGRGGFFGRRRAPRGGALLRPQLGGGGRWGFERARGGGGTGGHGRRRRC